MKIKESIPVHPHFDPHIRVQHNLSHNGENDAEFDNIAVVYSNNLVGGLSSRYRPGMTTIACYQAQKFVGCLVFYEENGPMHGGYIDPNGVISVEFPLDSFDSIMHLIEHSDYLALAYIDTDVNGTPLDHPLGALMTSRKVITAP